MMCADFFLPTQLPVQLEHSIATIGSVSLPLVTVMEFKTVLMAVMRLTALVSS